MWEGGVCIYSIMRIFNNFPVWGPITLQCINLPSLEATLRHSKLIHHSSFFHRLTLRHPQIIHSSIFYILPFLKKERQIMEVCLFLEFCILGFTYIKLFKTFNSPRLHPPMSLSFMLKISNVLRDTNLPNPLGKIKQPPKRIRYIMLISLPIPYGDSMYSKILSQVIFKKYNLHILQMVSGNLP